MVATSLRNKFLLRGLELSGILSCPLSAPIPFRAKIISSQVKKVGTEVVNVLGLAFVQISETDTEALGLYIARFGSHGRHLPSPRRLKKEGYGDVDVSDAIEWDYVRTQDDYQKVLELRRISYRSVEGWPADADDHLISDPFDERARIVIGRFRDTIIATLRVCFHEKGDVFEEELYITFPADFPARNTLVEASRAAIHPEFRGTHVFMNMMRFTMLTALQAGRKWFVQSTYDYLSHIYMRLGFKKVGGPWMHPQLTGRAMQMFIGNVHSVLHARYGNPFQYQSLVPHIEAFLKSDSFDELTLFEKSKLKVWKISAPLFKGYTRLEAYRSKMNRNIKFSKRLKNGILGRKQSKS
jgi:predicted GNAT family N-acyltransferase